MRAKQTYTPAQQAHHRETVRRYHANRPFITCTDCGEVRRQYGTMLWCRPCYAVRYQTGGPRVKPPSQPRQVVHCWVCFTVFQRPKRGQRTCSWTCRNILVKLRHFRGRIHECQRCHRWRLIRSKKLCASCYVLARAAMNAAGVYGACASRVNRFGHVPGVLGGT